MRASEEMTFAEANRLNISKIQHVRFYTCLILKEMLNDVPLEEISSSF